MKKIALYVLCFLTLTSFGKSTTTEITDVYDLKIALKVPRVYDNTKSLGYRKYQRQTIKGYMYVTYTAEDTRAIVEIDELVNTTHKINGRNITYKCKVNESALYTRWAYLGDNKKNKFTTPSVVFYLEAEPNYNIGEVDEDTSLFVTLSGSGTTSKSKIKGCVVPSKLSGTVSGTLGCGCMAYGHTSPTRLIGPCGPYYCAVTDVAAVYGTWTAKLNTKYSRSGCLICTR